MSLKNTCTFALALGLSASTTLALAKTSARPERASPSNALRAIHVNNFSIGAGIDEQGGRAVNALLATELTAGNLVRYVFQSNPMAIEGEYNTCAEFKSNAEMKRVIDLLKSATSGSTLIRLTEISSCVGGNWSK